MFFFEMRREKADTCEASCLAAASFCAEESAAYVRDVYRLPGTYLRAGIELARSATSWQLAVASYLAFVARTKSPARRRRRTRVAFLGADCTRWCRRS